MSKENFFKQVNNAKQQIINERLWIGMRIVEDRSYTKKPKIETEKEAERKRAMEVRRQAIIKNFTGTDIVETLEKIRDSGLLDNGAYKEINSVEIKNFFGRRTGRFKTEILIKKSPLKINYNIDSITALFDASHDLVEYLDWDSGGFTGIKITKNEDNFSLQYLRNGLLFLLTNSKNPSDIVGGIASIVAERQLK